MIKVGSVEWGQLVRMLEKYDGEDLARAVGDVFYRKAEKLRKSGDKTLADAFEGAADDLHNISLYE